MHISEGVLSGPVLLAGGALAAAGTAVGLKKIDYDRIARVGILSAAFFVASLVHVNIGPSSVHLILNGVVGLLLGWGAVPAILVALVLQALFFQYGGITVLGVNTIIMALPAIICYYGCGPLIRKKPSIAAAGAFLGGFGSVFLSAVFMAAALYFTEDSFWGVAMTVILAHLPVMAIEGVISAFCISFLKKVHPVLLPGHTG